MLQQQRDFSVACTGALAGTRLLGFRNRSQGAVITVSKDVFPYASILQGMTQDEKMEVACFMRQNQGFYGKSLDEILTWLQTHQSQDGMCSLGAGEPSSRKRKIDSQKKQEKEDSHQKQEKEDEKQEKEEESQIRVLSFGTSQLSKISEADKQRLLTDHATFTVREIEAMIPRPASTREEKNHTLMFHRSGWRIAPREDNIVVQPCLKQHLLFDLDSNKQLFSATDLFLVSGKKFILANEKIGIFYTSSQKPDVDPSSALPEKWSHFLKQASLGLLKSLIQKLIRFRGQKVAWDSRLPTNQGDSECDNSVRTDVFLRCCVMQAFLHKGCFVPQLQQYERGLSSTLKRLFVICFEDSWVLSPTMRSVLLGSLVSRADAEFFPNAGLCKEWIDFAVEMLESSDAVVYDSNVDAQIEPPFTHASPCFSRALESFDVFCHYHFLAQCSYFLDVLKSFKWDQSMVLNVAYSHRNKRVSFQRNTHRPPYMYVSRALDHHYDTNIVYLVSSTQVKLASSLINHAEIFGDFKQSIATPFADFFRALFQRHTGLNPRRGLAGHPLPPTSPFQEAVQEAQEILFRMRFSSPSPPTLSTVTREYVPWEYALDPMWIAGEIGHIKVKVGKLEIYVFLSQVKPTPVLTAVRVPARSQKDTTLDSATREKACQMAASMLMNGEVQIKDPQTRKPIVITWDQLSDPGFCLHLKQISAPRTQQEILEWKSKLSFHGFQRLKQLTAGFLREIVFPKLTREGGTDESQNKRVQTANINDVEVFEWLVFVASQAPDVLSPSPGSFHVLLPAVWWTWLDWMSKDKNQSICFSSHSSGLTADSQQRVLNSEQRNAVSKMKQRHRNKKNAHLIVMPTGTGKTLVMMSFLLWLQTMRELPDHILYVVPMESLKSIETELRYFTSKIIVFDARKGGKRKKTTENDNKDEIWVDGKLCFKKGYITLMDSLNHVRIVAGQVDFNTIMPQTLLIVDEFHKELAPKTQRSNIIQCLWANAFLKIGASATPIIGPNIYQLAPFLQDLVPFEITVQNFFAAYSFVVESLLSTGIEVKHETVYVPIDQPSSPPSSPPCSSSSSIDRYWFKMPRSLGGSNTTRLEYSELKELLDVELDFANKKCMELIPELLAKKQGSVMVVARDKAHAEQLSALFSKHSYRVLEMIRKEDVRTVTDPTEADIVLVTLKSEAGYTVLTCPWMILFVTPSNCATRKQILGRNNRLSTPFSLLTYFTLVPGALHGIMFRKQDFCDSFNSLLQEIWKL